MQDYCADSFSPFIKYSATEHGLEQLCGATQMNVLDTGIDVCIAILMM